MAFVVATTLPADVADDHSGCHAESDEAANPAEEYWHDGASPIRKGNCHNVGVALKVIGEKVYVDVGIYLTADLNFHVI